MNDSDERFDPRGYEFEINDLKVTVNELEERLTEANELKRDYMKSEQAALRCLDIEQEKAARDRDALQAEVASHKNTLEIVTRERDKWKDAYTNLCKFAKDDFEAQRGEGSLPFVVVADPSIPDDEARFVDDKGNVVGVIKNISAAAEKAKEEGGE